MCVCVSVCLINIDSLNSTGISCGRLSNPQNGKVFQQTPQVVGSVAVYSCNSGFILRGQRNRVCQIDGGYSGVAPTCEGKCHSIYIYSPHSQAAGHVRICSIHLIRVV